MANSKHHLALLIPALFPLLAFLLICAAEPSVAQVKTAASGAASALSPWQAITPFAAADATFTNLENGARIETPYVATFGLSGGWGLAPISSPVAGKSGHHHLLINRDLPLDFKQALPFNNQYIHFGKGQMETVLMLEPGDYTLRLLLADDKHLPHFIYSKPVKITVTKSNRNVDPKSLVKAGISLKNLPVDGKVAALFNVQFHASGLNVAHQSQGEKNTGHFRLTVAPQGGGKPVEMNFVNGQTEVWLSPPAGSYILKLDFVDNTNPDSLLAAPATAVVLVHA